MSLRVAFSLSLLLSLMLNLSSPSEAATARQSDEELRAVGRLMKVIEAGPQQSSEAWEEAPYELATLDDSEEFRQRLVGIVVKRVYEPGVPHVAAYGKVLFELGPTASEAIARCMESQSKQPRIVGSVAFSLSAGRLRDAEEMLREDPTRAEDPESEERMLAARYVFVRGDRLLGAADRVLASDDPPAITEILLGFGHLKLDRAKDRVERFLAHRSLEVADAAFYARVSAEAGWTGEDVAKRFFSLMERIEHEYSESEKRAASLSPEARAQQPDPDEMRGQRIQAIFESLGAVDTPGSLAFLLDLLRHADPTYRYHALSTLTERSDAEREVERLVTAVRPMADDDDVEVRGAALDALATLTGDRFLALFEERAASRDEVTRGHGAWALGLTGSERALDPVLKLLTDPSEFVRECAIGATTNLGLRRAIPHLRKLLEHPDPNTRQQARDAIEELRAIGR
jgi:bilin biosynthesis protein